MFRNSEENRKTWSKNPFSDVFLYSNFSSHFLTNEMSEINNETLPKQKQDKEERIKKLIKQFRETFYG